MPTLALFQGFGHWEMIIVLVVALLLFGKRLPEVGRSLGKGIVEFKRGIKGIEDELENESNQPERRRDAPQQIEDDDRPALKPPEGETFSRVDPASDAAKQSQKQPTE